MEWTTEILNKIVLSVDPYEIHLMKVTDNEEL